MRDEPVAGALRLVLDAVVDVDVALSLVEHRYQGGHRVHVFLNQDVGD